LIGKGYALLELRRPTEEIEEIVHKVFRSSQAMREAYDYSVLFALKLVA